MEATANFSASGNESPTDVHISSTFQDDDALPVELDWLTENLDTHLQGQSLSATILLPMSHRNYVSPIATPSTQHVSKAGCSNTRSQNHLIAHSGNLSGMHQHQKSRADGCVTSAPLIPANPQPFHQVSSSIAHHQNIAQSHIISSTTLLGNANAAPHGYANEEYLEMESSNPKISHLSDNINTGGKHTCSICGDRASGKHYGVYRNRCQYCRYQKCLFNGMKREAVQEERHRQRCDRSDGGEPESTSNFVPDMPHHQILEAELLVEQNYDQENIQGEHIDSIEMIEGQIRQLVDWARVIPRFTDLTIDDQSVLIHTGWSELILGAAAFRSSPELLLIGLGHRFTRSDACRNGLMPIFDRISTELISKFQELSVDQTEIGCLRTIILFNPDAVGLKAVQQVEGYREKVYACLEEYCRSNHPQEPGRFAKLLLRLPVLRCVGIKCLDCVNLIPPVPSLSCLIQTLSTRPSVRLPSDCLY